MGAAAPLTTTTPTSEGTSMDTFLDLRYVAQACLVEHLPHRYSCLGGRSTHPCHGTGRRGRSENMYTQ
jgi:hypothetical protein